MRKSKYSELLQEEMKRIKNINPLDKKDVTLKGKKVPHYIAPKKNNNYFSLILDSGFEDIEMEIRGLRYMKVFDSNGKEKVVLQRKENHYLTEKGAEDILAFFKSLVRPDIKLGISTHEEYLQTMDIITTSLINYLRENLYNLGMDTESKQRNAPLLAVMLISNIRSAFSRSVEGKENTSTHGEIKLSGDLDNDRQDRFKIADAKT